MNDEEYLALEAEFTKVCDEHMKEIQDKLSAAAILIDEAEALSEKYGLPFRPKTSIMWCRPSYLPKTFEEKFPDLDCDAVDAITNASGDYNYPGWQVSQTC